MLAGILVRRRSGRPLAFMLLIRHCRPFECVRGRVSYQSQIKPLDEKSDTDIPAGEMVEFEVMIRPIKALAAPGEEMGNRIGP
jgi:hypothetical protein